MYSFLPLITHNFQMCSFSCVSNYFIIAKWRFRGTNALFVSKCPFFLFEVCSKNYNIPLPCSINFRAGMLYILTQPFVIPHCVNNVPFPFIYLAVSITTGMLFGYFFIYCRITHMGLHCAEKSITFFLSFLLIVFLMLPYSSLNQFQWAKRAELLVSAIFYYSISEFDFSGAVKIFFTRRCRSLSTFNDTLSVV
jgi:hypothetical protein